jgi:hypothetical protein
VSAASAVAFARAATLSAVISPFRSESCSTSATAWAAMIPDDFADTLEDSGPDRAPTPSAGYAKPPAAPVEAGPGALEPAADAPG